MDLYVEKQCVDQMKATDPKKFLLLYEAYFSYVYKYVARRVDDSAEIERITKLTFLDAVGQIQSTPTDIAYLVWLYSLAKPRVWSYINKASFPKKQGLISTEDVVKKDDLGADMTIEKSERVFKKLSMEEGEILRLKFFEELADGDVLYVLGGEETLIGPKIYRVLKRAHFLLFGESDQRQGIYFGELSGFLERVKDAEKIEVPEAFKLNMKAELSTKLDRREFAVEGEQVQEKQTRPIRETSAREEFPEPILSDEGATPWKDFGKAQAPEDVTAGAPPVKPVGSSDPAKIFVAAVKEMKEEEEALKLRQQLDDERREQLLEIFDKLKGLLIVIPLVVFVIIGWLVVKNLDVFHQGKVKRGLERPCVEAPVFAAGFTDFQKNEISKDVGSKLCAEFDVQKMAISRAAANKIVVYVDLSDAKLEYRFTRENGQWQLKQYAKKSITASNSNAEPGKIRRNI